MPELAGLSLFNDANLQAYYKLEDANDNKNANHLTNNNSVTFPAAKFNNGADMGSTDTDKTLNRTDANGYANGAHAISVWMKVNTAPATGLLYQIVNHYSTTSQINFDYQDVAGVKTLHFTRFNGTTLEGPSYIVDLGTSVFHHIVWTYDGTNIRGYLDGVLVAGPTAASGATGGFIAGFVIAGQPNSLVANNALAVFDDVAIFTRNLTAAEVSLIYTATGGLNSRTLLGVGS